MEDTVTIPLSEYEALVEDANTLAKLYAGGVDNWEWYEEALFGEDT